MFLIEIEEDAKRPKSLVLYILRRESGISQNNIAIVRKDRREAL